MHILNSQYHDANKVDNGFWREIGVKSDAITETESILLSARIKAMLATFKMPALLELCELYDIAIRDDEESIKDQLRSLPLEQRHLILFLHDFSNRKKKTIYTYYDNLTLEETQYTKSSLAKLLHLYKTNPVHLIQIFTWYLWDNRASGKLFVFDKAISSSVAHNIAREYNFHVRLRDTLFQGSGNKNYYRVFSSSTVNNKVLILLYRLISDAPRPDFVTAPRNREVSPALFLIDVEKKTVEIKALTTEEASIKKYLEQTFGSPLSEVQTEVFTEYKKEVFINTIIKGSSTTAIGQPVRDFTIFKIRFRNSPLKNSPKVTLELDDLDIWPSVEEAHAQGVVNLESLKDLESMHFKSSEGSRVIKSTILENGNVIFSMDDSNLDQLSKKAIEKKFIEKFGVPLYREISNEHFEEGKADKVDYLLAASSVEKPSPYERSIIATLKDQKILEENVTKYFYCANCQIDYSYEDSEDVPNKCDSCDGQQIITKVGSVLNANINEVYKFIKERIKVGNTTWFVSRENELNLGSTKLKCMHLTTIRNEEKHLQLVFADKSIQKSALKYLNRQMKPTLLILIGQQERMINYNDYSCVEPTNFGKIYIKGEQEFPLFLDEIYETLERRTKTYISATANAAFHAISNLSEEKLSKKEYTDKMFEDHVYAMLKDIFPNAEKWGKEMSGQEVPEGIFTVSFRDDKENKVYQKVFSYDCKLNINGKGYDLNISEQRKAVQYVNTLNQNDYIRAFSDHHQLSGHIFISNQFRENNFKTMSEHFYQHLDDSYDTQAIFLDVKVLCYLYDNFCKHSVKINNSRKIFYRDLFKALMAEQVTISSIDNVLRKALDEHLAEYKTLPTNKITLELKGQ
ncbi:hypothetical protein Elgi_55120 [Paenibacillus elgii]|uniref:hypothetical protein n=1 Tax=Paenibacillus elgii TaxID=189691 RepID=UPI002D7C4DF2|nr:hypothetical protein Elgi_55120 [Paenibacillus elgii]